MPTTPGTRFGPYEVVAPLGAGGMGEVWRGRDTRLERSVAIKVLPDDFSRDEQLKLRFEREAKTISQLNHPNICTLYDVGDNYLVMELLDGETLADRIGKGPLPLDQLVRYGVQIAAALEKAHKAGVVHRDLKPGNVMITKSGAKLLDFGLAKPTDGGVITALTSVRTEAKNLTQEGVIVGTFQYMAPEQIEGGSVDARTDIFALGAVLYEMATGRRAFEGKSKASLIASILTVDPQPIGATQPLAPASLDRVVRMCMKKDPDERWQSAHDVAAELRWLAEPQTEVRTTRSRSAGVAWLLAGLLAIATIASGWMWLRERQLQRDAPPTRTLVLPPDKMQFDFLNYAAPPAISPDGQRIVFGAAEPGRRRTLWVRSLDSLTARQIADSDDAMFPFWSSDGRYIAFFSDNSLKRVEASGGSPIQICSVTDGRGGSWSPDGQTIIFAARYSPIYRVSAAGGTPVAVTTITGYESTHRWPEFLPDGKHFLFLSSPSGNEDPQNEIIAGSVDGKLRKSVLTSSDEARYVDGALVFSRDHILTAQRFDLKTLELSGDPVALKEPQVQATPLLSRTVVSVGPAGTLVYQPGTGSRDTQLQWFDRSGKAIGMVGDNAPYSSVAIAPDGKSVVVAYATSPANLWLFDLSRGVKTRTTFGVAREGGPVFSSDGQKVAYGFVERGRYHFHVKELATGADEEVMEGEAVGSPTVTSWSADGRSLLCTIGGRTTRGDIVVLSLADRKLRPYLATPYIENNGRFSPDGKWIVYQSNESGVSEIYLAPFPPTGAKWQVSSGAGVVPRWRADGKEIFYASVSGNTPATMIAIPVTLSATPQFGQPAKLFQFVIGSPGSMYDVTSDGQRFLVNKRIGEEPPPQPLVVVQHFSNELRAALEHRD